MPRTKKVSTPGGVVFSYQVRSDLDEAIDSLQQQLTETNASINQAQREREALAVQVSRLEAELHILRGNYGDISHLLVLLERVRSAEQPAAAVRRRKSKPAPPEEPNTGAKRRRGTVTAEKRKAIWRLHDEGKDAEQIAPLVGLHANTVRRALKGERPADVGTESGSAAPSPMAPAPEGSARPARKRGVSPNAMSDREQADVLNRQKAGEGVREIAEAIGRAPSTVSRFLRSRGVKVKPAGRRRRTAKAR